MKLKPYPKYKDSGIEWIGEIPEEWEVRKLKFNCQVNPSGKKYVFDEKISVTFLPMEAVTADGNYDRDSEAEYKEVAEGYTYFTNNDVLLAKITPCFENGKGTLVDHLKNNIGFGSTEFHILRSNSSSIPKYVYYFTKTPLFRNVGEAFMEGAAGQKRIGTYFTKNFPMFTPSIKEQNNIVEFLDNKTSEINQTIEKDKRLIELLKEKRTALINNAVTKGLSPNAKMKDSGIDWIGEIPEDWNVDRLKFLVSKINSGITPKGGSAVYTDQGIPLLRSQNIHFDGLKLEDVAYIPEDIYQTMLNSAVKRHDVLINITGASIGRCTHVEKEFEKANVNQHVCIMRPKKIFYKYLSYYLRSRLGQDQVFSVQMGTSREGLNFEQLGNFIVFHPNKQEQQKIVQYLDKQTSKIDKTIQKIERKIELLEEYKKSLIHYVITGKIDVRSVAA